MTLASQVSTTEHLTPGLVLGKTSVEAYGRHVTTVKAARNAGHAVSVQHCIVTIEQSGSDGSDLNTRSSVSTWEWWCASRH